MSAENNKEGVIQAKLSVAIIAHMGNMADFSSTKVLLVKNKDGKWGPPAGHIDCINGVPEHPLIALKREWLEETNTPFQFKRRVQCIDNVFSIKDGCTSIGFVFRATLTDKAVEIFERGKRVDGDKSIIYAKLASVDDVIKLLKSWKEELARPEINAQTLIRFCNTIKANYDSLFFSSIKSQFFTNEDFGIDFPTTLLSLSGE